MLKNIRKTDLKLGMYIHDLQVPWISHAFLRSSFMLRKQSDLERIQASDVHASAEYASSSSAFSAAALAFSMTSPGATKLYKASSV